MPASKTLVLVALLGAAVAAHAATPEKAREAERHYKSGVEAMKAESWDEAAEEFRAATAADPDMVLAHYNLGQCRMAQRRYVEAAAAYRDTKDSFTRASHFSGAESASRERELQDQIRELRDSINVLNTIKDGSADRRAMEIENRIRLLESMRLKGGRPPEMPAEFALALGSAYFRQEKLDEARAEYEEAVRLNPKLGAAHNNLAVINLLTGHPAEAKAALAAARKSGFPVNPQLEADIKKANAH